MTESRSFNVYCDESCHLENDGVPVMAWGAVYCPLQETASVSHAIRDLKATYGMSETFEAKWTKISPAREDFYLALLDFFLITERLRFRGLVVPDKSVLDHRRFSQSHDDWYYKMYFNMLRPVFCAPHRYRIYLDVKDSRGGPKSRKLHEVLANSLLDFDRECVERVQQVRSHETELLQIADILIGALTYSNRGLAGNHAKLAIIARLRERLGVNVLNRTSPFSATKFNILMCRSREER